jgi:uncharacterized protein (DUF302 family)
MKRFIPVIALATLMAAPRPCRRPAGPAGPDPANAGSPGQNDGSHDDGSKSRLGFKETVAALQDAAKKRGWQVGQIVDMQEAMIKAGQKNAKPFTVLPMCKQDLAENLLKTQVEQKAMPFAPCRISVFEGTDGKVYIAKPNTEFMAQMATPVFAPLLKKFVEEEKALLANIAE